METRKRKKKQRIRASIREPARSNSIQSYTAYHVRFMDRYPTSKEKKAWYVAYYDSNLLYLARYIRLVEKSVIRPGELYPLCLMVTRVDPRTTRIVC